MEKLTLSESEETGETEEIDESVWVGLGAKKDGILEDKYVSAQTAVLTPR